VIDLRRIPRAPAEGWLTVGLVLLLGLSLAWALVDARWVLGQVEYTSFLPWAMGGGILAGLVAAKAGWGRWPGHLIGAVFAALIVPLLVGAILQPAGGTWRELYERTASSVVEAALSIARRGNLTTQQYEAFVVFAGLLCWATGQFAATAVFRHHRPLSAVLAIGVALVLNMSLTKRDQLWYLIEFSLAALFLLVRLHAFDERATWLRRRIGDPSLVAGHYLRGGTTFVVTAVIAAFVLTASASSAPLAGAWTGIDEVLIDVGGKLKGWFPYLTPPQGPAFAEFGGQSPITGVWTTDDKIAFSVTRRPGDERVYYWRAAVYDRLDGTTWLASAEKDWPFAADEPFLDWTPEAPNPAGHARVELVISTVRYAGSAIFSPETPVSVDEGVNVVVLGDDAYFVRVERQQKGRPYEVTALVWEEEGPAHPDGLSRNKLRAAGTKYPFDVLRIYGTRPSPDVLGPDSRAFLADVKAGLPRGYTPFDVAAAIERRLRSGEFRYETNVQGIDPGGRSVVEFFFHEKVGYCQYYATAMIMLLRQEGIPARLAMGYLPGTRNRSFEQVENRKAHAWVEVYFPGYGWVMFDPTGGSVSRNAPLPEGAAVPTPSPTPVASLGPGEGEEPDRTPRRPSPSGAGPIDRGGPGPFIVAGMVLLGGFGLLAFAIYRRGPRGPLRPDDAYRGIVRLAERFGFAPRPTQTVYEFTAALAEVVPLARPDLMTVAEAKVEVAYGRRLLPEDRMRALRDAVARLRVSLLRLAFRRRERRRRR
jgi:transglutaminase-like putative cysteine protease